MINPVKGMRQQEGGKGYYQEITICTTRPEEYAAIIVFEIKDRLDDWRKI